MKVKLKVVQGKLKGKRDESARLEVAISKARFVIGTAEDCNMRCPSSTISPHHCEITVDGDKVRLRDLGSESGTFLNDERLDSEQAIQSGDQLQVGRLRFEFVIEPTTKKADAVDDFVSDLLVQADEEEREIRRADPELRQFHLDPNQPKEPEQAEPEEEEDRLAALRKKIPPKKPPGKLPPPPSISADSTISAAEQSLEKIFEKPKPKGPKY
jgi:pSer/pThr/pTyr-binding forkhead associated (FHA) protein